MIPRAPGGEFFYPHSISNMRRFFQPLFFFLIAFKGTFLSTPLQAEENFIVMDGSTRSILKELGSSLDKRITPCSTFKIALSLMGYDAGILLDERVPIWDFQDGYDDFLEVWKGPQTPRSWMKSSCVWFSKVLVSRLGVEGVKKYLHLMEYGNQDLSASNGFDQEVADSSYPFWLNASLKISPREQVEFIQKMLIAELPISLHSMERTKSILFIEELEWGGKLFGKTGWSGCVKDPTDMELGWFVGWIENNHGFFPFSYVIFANKVELGQRIPRVKQLLKDLRVHCDGSV